jgi:hypothetical protein
MEIGPTAISYSRRLVLSLPLMLRSIAARGERRCFHSRSTLRCVSKHEGEPYRPSSSFETRVRAFEFAERLRHARSSGRGRAARTAGPIPVFSCFFADSESSIPGLTISSTHISSFPRRIFAPGFCIVASLTPNRGVGGAPRNVRVLGEAPVGHAVTRRVRRLRGALRPIARQDARERAYDAGRSPLGAPPWRF